MSENTADNYNKSGFYAFVFAMVFSFLFFIYISFVHPGVQLDKVEEIREKAMKMANAADGGNAAAAVDVSGNQAPWETSEAMIAHGKVVYKTNCAFCHGDTGMGDGPAGLSLNPRPRNFVEGKWSADGSTIGLFKSIKAGLPGTAMAPFGHIPTLDRWAMVHFIQSITKNKIESDKAQLEAFGKAEK